MAINRSYAPSQLAVRISRDRRTIATLEAREHERALCGNDLTSSERAMLERLRESV